MGDRLINLIPQMSEFILFFRKQYTVRAGAVYAACSHVDPFQIIRQSENLLPDSLLFFPIQEKNSRRHDSCQSGGKQQRISGFSHFRSEVRRLISITGEKAFPGISILIILQSRKHFCFQLRIFFQQSPAETGHLSKNRPLTGNLPDKNQNDHSCQA